MDTEYRFNRDEISKILKRAAELEHQNKDGDEGEGLTLEELQQVSKDVGINPKFINQALVELQSVDERGASNLLGGPFTYQTQTMADRPINDEDWEDIVTQIRNIHGGIGRTSKLGKTYEWEQRKREVGYIQISISPKKDHSRIHLSANYRYYALLVYMFAGIFSLMASGILLDEFALSFMANLIAVPVIVLSLFTGARFYLSGWMKRKHRTYKKLLSQVKKKLSRDSHRETAPSISISENQDRDGSEDHQVKRNRQRT